MTHESIRMSPTLLRPFWMVIPRTAWLAVTPEPSISSPSMRTYATLTLMMLVPPLVTGASRNPVPAVPVWRCDAPTRWGPTGVKIRM